MAREKPIIHSDRMIGDTAELTPASVAGQRGPLKEIIRTTGDDEGAQLLTVTIMGSGVFESSAFRASDPRGPLFAEVEWGIKGTHSSIEMDLPQGGVVFSVVASYLRVSARYDGLVVVNGVKLDPVATGGQNPSPTQRAGAMVGYGSYGQAARLTRTFRFNDVPLPLSDVDPPPFGPQIRLPNFAKSVLATGIGIESGRYRVRIFGFDPLVRVSDMSFAIGEAPRFLDLPGDCGYVQLENLGPNVISSPALVFELGI